MRGSAVATLVACLAVAGCAKDVPPTVGLYDRVPVPAVPDRTADIPSGIAAGTTPTLTDGTYWAADVADASGQLRFTLTQAFFGPTCTKVLGADNCTDDYGSKETPSADVVAAPADLATVTVVDVKRDNFAVTGAELEQLVRGGSPSTLAPSGFAYVAFPFVVTITDGHAVAARQIWVP